MKRVLVSDDAALEVSRMRDFIGSYESVKSQIADSMCNLARMLSNGMDIVEDNVLKYYANEVIDAMVVIADYNDIVDKLSDSRDVQLPRYVLDVPEEDNESRSYDYAPNERELEAIKKILEEKGVKLQGVLQVDEMTLSEIAAAAGVPDEEFHKLVNYVLHVKMSGK